MSMNSASPPSYGQATSQGAPSTPPPSEQGRMTWQQGMTPPPAAGGVNPTGPGQSAPAGGGGMPKFQSNSKYALGNLARPFDPLATRLVGGPAGFGGGGIKGMIDPLGVVLGRDAPKKVKGSIDPATGTVDVSNYGKYQPGLEAAYTQYLRTGRVPNELKHGKGAFKNLKREIAALHNTGWKWGTPSAGAPTTIPSQGPVNWGPQPGTAPPNPGTSQRPPQLPSAPAYNPQMAMATALRRPSGGGSRLVGVGG